MKAYDLSAFLKLPLDMQYVLMIALGQDEVKKDQNTQLMMQLMTVGLGANPMGEEQVNDCAKLLYKLKTDVATHVDAMIALLEEAPEVNLPEQSNVQDHSKKFH